MTKTDSMKAPASGTATTKKDVIYIDVDDEITSIIEKLRATSNRIVALVLPKRASVLQSVVNMKLLKRSAEGAKKHVVLITTEAGILPLAGHVGLHVARTLQSKPVIPPAPDLHTGVQPIDTVGGFDDFDPDAEASQSIGDLADMAVASEEPETIELDNEPDAAAVEVTSPAADAPKTANKKLKVPNFNKFRVAIIVGCLGLVGLVVLLYVALVVLPKATVTVLTNSSSITTNVNATLDPAVSDVNTTAFVLPAKIEQKQQTSTQSVSTSGQKNNGDKASGNVTMTAGSCSADAPADVPAGTGVSANGLTFITQVNTSFIPKLSGGKCTFTADTTTKVLAQSAGANYNIAPSSFSVAGRPDVSAKSSEAMTGGTDNNIKVVAQADIDSAKQKIANADSTNVKNDLVQKLQSQGYEAIPSSLLAADPVVTPSAQVGAQADTVSVNQITSYTMYGIKQADLKKLVLANVSKQIDVTKQNILDDGVAKASFQVTSPASSGKLQTALSAKSVAGPDINQDQLKTAIAGKKASQVQTIIKQIPGVTDVSVKYSPFWVSHVPTKTSKITFVIDK